MSSAPLRPLCTCGVEFAGQDKHFDMTGACERGEHHHCRGLLRGATGYHWWCVCACHPDLSGVSFKTPDALLAQKTWQRARERKAAT